MSYQTLLMNILSNFPNKNPSTRQRRKTKEEYQNIDRKNPSHLQRGVTNVPNRSLG